MANLSNICVSTHVKIVSLQKKLGANYCHLKSNASLAMVSNQAAMHKQRQLRLWTYHPIEVLFFSAPRKSKREFGWGELKRANWIESE